MNRKEDLSAFPFQKEINWSTFPKPARRIIKEMLEDITSEVDSEPDSTNAIKQEVIECIGEVSMRLTAIRSANQVGKEILEVAEIVDLTGEKPASVAFQLSLIGNALIKPEEVSS